LGLMQLNKNTYPELAKELKIDNFDPFNPYHNSRAGIYYLYKIREELRDKDLSDEEIFPVMLLTYHRGFTGARKYISRNGVRSKYVDKILEQKYEYESDDY
jgi:soluble lytic murein transglycosylase-like protein